KTTKNTNGSGYRQVSFVCEKQEQYNRKKNEYIIKRTGYSFIIRVNYHKRTKEFAITRLHLEHNYVLCPDARRFSNVIHRLDQNNLGLNEKFHDDRLRTKDIFSILSLNKIEMLFKTLYNAKNIIANIAIKPLYNDACNQDSAFIQAIFWIYHSAAAKFALSKDVLIIDTTYKTNRFSIPLIVICSIDRFGTTYPLAFALVYSET
ncbi:27961_t:CDS:2, partial [Gigaspora margarita]